MWDSWPLQHEDGRTVSHAGRQWWFFLSAPCFGDARALTFVASDDAEARAIVTELARDVGLDAVEAGPLSFSRYLEVETLLWIGTSGALQTRDFAFTRLQRSEPVQK